MKTEANHEEILQLKQELRFVDATPNAEYPLRILRAYIDESNWSDNTLGLPPESWLCKQMNEWQAERNKLLKNAIEKITSPTSDDVEALQKRCEYLGERLAEESQIAEARYIELSDLRQSASEVVDLCKKYGIKSFCIDKTISLLSNSEEENDDES